MTNSIPHGQAPEALRLAEQYDHGDPAAHGNAWKAAVCTELRRQHNRIAELEAKLKNIAGPWTLGEMTGNWRDIDLPDHGAVMRIVWKMEDDEGRNEALEAQARAVVEALNAASHTPTAEQQAATKAAPGVGNSGFDHQTAADFLSGKTVSDEAVRKFVQAARWAHDEKAALSAMLLSVRGVLASREAEIALLKTALMEAEAAPQQEAQEPVAYVHVPHYPVEGKVRPVVSFEKYQQDYDDGIYSTRIPLYAAPQPSPMAQAAESVPAIQGEMNVQLDIDSNHSAPGQQRDMACSLALGQPVGNGSDQVAGHPSAQEDKLLTVAERNIRSFLRSATFKSESDREAALNCVDVLWEAARATAESVQEDAARYRWLREGNDAKHGAAWPKVSGVSRDEGHSRALLVFFAAEPTDDEVRAVHDTLAAAPQPAPAPLSEMPYEKRKAIQEGEQIGASDAWFHARHNMLDTLDRRNVFRAGFDRGWNAAIAAQGGK